MSKEKITNFLKRNNINQGESFIDVNDEGIVSVFDECLFPQTQFKIKKASEDQKQIFQLLLAYIQRNPNEFQLGEYIHQNFNFPDDCDIKDAVLSRPYWSELVSEEKKMEGIIIVPGTKRVKVRRKLVKVSAMCTGIIQHNSGTKIHPNAFFKNQYLQLKKYVSDFCRVSHCLNRRKENHLLCSLHTERGKNFKYDILELYEIKDKNKWIRYDDKIKAWIEKQRIKIEGLLDKSSLLRGILRAKKKQIEKRSFDNISNRYFLFRQEARFLIYDLSSRFLFKTCHFNDWTDDEHEKSLENKNIIHKKEIKEKKKEILNLYREFLTLYNQTIAQNYPNSEQWEDEANNQKTEGINSQNQQRFKEESQKISSEQSSLSEYKLKTKKLIQELFMSHMVDVYEIKDKFWLKDGYQNWEDYLQNLDNNEEVAEFIKKMKRIMLLQSEINLNSLNDNSQSLESIKEKYTKKIEEIFEKNPNVKIDDLDKNLWGKEQGWKKYLEKLNDKEEIYIFAEEMCNAIIFANQQKNTANSWQPSPTNKENYSPALILIISSFFLLLIFIKKCSR